MISMTDEEREIGVMGLNETCYNYNIVRQAQHSLNEARESLEGVLQNPKDDATEIRAKDLMKEVDRQFERNKQWFIKHGLPK